MYKAFFIILCSALVYGRAPAQWTAGIEQYSYTGMPLAEAIVPVCHIQSANNWYAELRYNYEEARTLSLFGGKTFSGGHDLQYDITPLAGFSTGRFTGISFAINADAAWKGLYFSSQSQYSIAVKKNEAGFLFSWMELGYSVTRHFFTGVTMQYTRQTGRTDIEPGFLAGLSFKNISFPFYVFKPFYAGGYFVLGVNYEFTLKRRKRSEL